MRTICRRSFLRSVPLTALAAGWISRTPAAQSASAAAEDHPTSVRKKSEPYKKTSQRELQIHLYLPSDWTEGDKRPAIVFFFGGGWQNGSPSQFAHQAERLAQRGMVAACADYRVKSKDGVGPRSCVEDAKSAVRWLRANGARLGIDPERIVAGGGSAGGHLAACTALTPDLIGENEDGAISSKTSAMVLFNPVLNFSGEPRLLERIDNDETLAKLISPTLHLETGSPPATLFYGALDMLLPQGEAFAARSRELGNRAELHVPPGQNHGYFNKPPYREDTLHLAEQFLASLGMLNNTSVEVETTPAPA